MIWQVVVLSLYFRSWALVRWIVSLIDDSLHDEMDIHYEKLNQKLDKLQQKHKTTEPKPRKHMQTAYARTVNVTNVLLRMGILMLETC
jgi:glucan phosphorylase